MFDSHHRHVHVSNGPSHVSVTKTEQRAPTDESVKLLREMEQAAAAKVLESVRVTNTLVDGVLHVKRDLISDESEVACVFKINGTRMQANYKVKPFDKKADIAVGIRDATAVAIANELTTAVLAACDKLKFQR